MNVDPILVGVLVVALLAVAVAVVGRVGRGIAAAPVERRDPLAAFVRGRKRDGRIVGRYGGLPVEAWVVPAEPPDEKRNRFVVDMGAGRVGARRGGSWTYLGGGAWERPRDHRFDPQLTGDDAAIVAELERLGARRVLASLDLYRPELRYDGERGRLRYRQEVPGEAVFPDSDTFAQILSTLRRVAEINRAAQRAGR